GIPEPVEVVEQALCADDRRRTGSGIWLQMRLAVRHANARAVLVLRSSRCLAENAEVELQVRVVSGKRPRLVDVLLRLRRHCGPLGLGREFGTTAAAGTRAGAAPFST